MNSYKYLGTITGAVPHVGNVAPGDVVLADDSLKEETLAARPDFELVVEKTRSKAAPAADTAKGDSK